MTKDQNDYLKNWLFRANEDIAVIKNLSESGLELYGSTICFHAQQYVEKIIKGLLEINRIKPPRIHDLITLNELCNEINIKLPLSEDNLQFLSSVYIDTRYPPDAGLIPNGEPTEEHSRLAYQIVKELDKWIKKSVKNNEK